MSWEAEALSGKYQHSTAAGLKGHRPAKAWLNVTGGAGIGSGENADYTGTITISGGVVYAVGRRRFSEHRRAADAV